LLAGLIYDAAGQRLVSSHTSKHGKRYRYYVAPELSGRQSSDQATTKLRLPAAELDEHVLSGLQGFLTDKERLSSFLRKQGYHAATIGETLTIAAGIADELAAEATATKHTFVADLVSRIVILKDRLEIRVRLGRLSSPAPPRTSQAEARNDEAAYVSFEVPFSPNRLVARSLLIEMPSRRRPDPVVVKAIARAHQWFEDLASGRARSMAEIALRENVTDNYVNNLIHLAWLPPKVVESILDGNPQATAAARKLMLSRDIDPIWENAANVRRATVRPGPQAPQAVWASTRFAPPDLDPLRTR
jgi:site-specific DNA recombinase